MRLFIFYCLLVTSTTVIAQKKLGLGMMLSPSLEKQVWLGDDWIEFKNKPSLNAGVKINYHLTAKLSIETGVELNDKGSRFQAYWLNAPSLDTPLVKMTQYIWYVGIPVELCYSFHISTKLKLLFQSGLIAGRKVWEFQMQNVNGERFYNREVYSSTSNVYYGFRIGTGVKMKISKKFEVEIQPNYTRQLNRGWGKSTVMDNDGRYDSYSLKTVLWYQKSK